MATEENMIPIEPLNNILMLIQDVYYQQNSAMEKATSLVAL